MPIHVISICTYLRGRRTCEIHNPLLLKFPNLLTRPPIVHHQAYQIPLFVQNIESLPFRLDLDNFLQPLTQYPIVVLGSVEPAHLDESLTA